MPKEIKPHELQRERDTKRSDGRSKHAPESWLYTPNQSKPGQREVPNEEGNPSTPSGASDLNTAEKLILTDEEKRARNKRREIDVFIAKNLRNRIQAIRDEFHDLKLDAAQRDLNDDIKKREQEQDREARKSYNSQANSIA